MERPRKIVQLAAAGDEGLGMTLWALADDGTAWINHNPFAGGPPLTSDIWLQLPPLPPAQETP